MRYLFVAAFLLLSATQAWGWYALLMAVDDYGLTYDGETYGLEPDPPYLEFNAGPLNDRSIIVFPKPTSILADNITSAWLRIYAPAGHYRYCKITAYPSDTPEGGTWEVRNTEEVFGYLVIDASTETRLKSYNILGDLRRIWDSPEQYMHFKISSAFTPCNSSSCTGSYLGINNPEGRAGPYISMSGVPPVHDEVSSWGTIKSLYR